MNSVNPAGPVVIAIDAGTGSARTMAFAEDGTVVARASREWTHRPVPGHPGGMDFDTETGWQLIAATLREVTEQLGERPIAAVGASSMREGFVLYDEVGREIWACPNTDGRARAQAAELVDEGVAERIYQLGGDWVSITAPARLRWIAQEQPEVLAATRHFGMLSDWVTFRLTGLFTTDPSCGSSSALFDVAARDWSAELVSLVGLDLGVMPTVIECGTVVGGVTVDASNETGLLAGIPVVVGGADTQLALHGIGADADTATIVAGTFWQTTAITDTAVVDPHRRVRTLCHVQPDRWMVEGIGFLSGLAMRWFRDAFCPDLVYGARESGASAFDLMEVAAAGAPAGSNGLVAVLSNVMQADSWHHAAPSFVNFDINDPDGFNRGTFIRSIEEAAAYVARAHLEILDELTDGRVAAAGRVTFTGGSSGGSLWPQIVADITGRAVRLSDVPDATSYGVARLAGAAVGLHIPPAVNGNREVPNDALTSAEYEGHYRRWREVYRAQLVATRASPLTALFTPPGGLPPASGAPAARNTRVGTRSVTG